MKYQVWMEGYRANADEYSPARCLGEVEASSFQEACDILGPPNEGYPGYYDSKRRTIWGCRLFDNETDARRSFG